MERESFIFFTSWLSGIEGFTEEEQAEIAFALLRYCAFGKEPNLSKPYVRLAFTFAKPQIDANNIRYLNGKKGGRPTKGKNLNETESEPNDNVNVNVNVNENDNENVNENVNENFSKKELLSEEKKTKREIAEEKARVRFEDRAKQLVQDDSRFGKFNKWLIKNARFIVGHYKHLVTAEELDRLLAEYSSELISNTILNLENDVKRRWGYVNLYLVLSRNWLPYELEKWQRHQITAQRLVSSATSPSKAR